MSKRSYHDTVQWFPSSDIMSALFRHPPSQLHSDVQRRPALLHLQLPLHDLVHSQYKRREHALLASARVVQNGIHCLLCCHFPKIGKTNNVH